VDLGVALGQLQRLPEGRLRLLQPSLLEAHEAQVVVEGVGLRALGDQLAVDLLRLGQLLAPEVDEAEEVQDPRVARAQEVGLLQLPLGLLEPPGLEELPALVEVGEEEPLVERAAGIGSAIASPARAPSSRPCPPAGAPRPRG